MGFHSIIGSGVLDLVPKLKLAFLEAGSEWVPYVIHRIRAEGKLQKDPVDYFRENRVYVGCEVTDNIRYITECLGEDCLVIGSDYPHEDPFREENVVEKLTKRPDVTPGLREKILSTNAQRLYGL